MITTRSVLIVLAFILFLLAAVGIKHPRFDLVAAGLALMVLAMAIVQG